MLPLTSCLLNLYRAGSSGPSSKPAKPSEGVACVLLLFLCFLMPLRRTFPHKTVKRGCRNNSKPKGYSSKLTDAQTLRPKLITHLDIITKVENGNFDLLVDNLVILIRS